MNTSVTVISIIVAGLLIGGAVMLSGGSSDSWQGNTVSIQDGTQVVEITAKGGYAPRITKAQANMPTVLKVKTRGTFDCSAALSVPAVGYRTFLPATGETLVEIPPQKPGATVQGVCAMGMYNFQVLFN